MLKLITVLAAFALGLGPALATDARAATLIVGGDGQLLGADGVSSRGERYDVRFFGDPCGVHYDGCDSADDLPLRSGVAAEDLARALLEQVFLNGAAGRFDSDPELTRGCEDSVSCSILIPYDITRPIIGSPTIAVVAAVNGAAFFNRDNDVVEYRSIAFDPISQRRQTLAVVTPSATVTPDDPSPVPVPAALPLLLIALGATSLVARRT